MDDRDLEARLRAHLHRRFDDAQPPQDFAPGIEQVLATEPRRIGIPVLRLGRERPGWSFAAVAVLVAVVALAAIGLRPLIGPAAPTQSPPVGPSANLEERFFMVLPPTSAVPAKAESGLASDVLALRLRALGIGNFTSATGNAIQFTVPAAGPTDGAILTVLAADGDVAFVPLPAADYGDGRLAAAIGAPLPKDEPALFGWEGIDSVTSDASGSSPALNLRLKPAAADAFEVYTSQHVGEAFAVLIDGLVALVPVIQAPITGGEVTLSAGFTEDPFRTAAAIIAGGRLPEAWRGATAADVVIRENAVSTAVKAAAQPGSTLRSADLDAIVIDGGWRAVWNVVLDGNFPRQCVLPLPPPSCEAVTTKLVVVDAVTGAILSSQAPAP